MLHANSAVEKIFQILKPFLNNDFFNLVRIRDCRLFVFIPFSDSSFISIPNLIRCSIMFRSNVFRPITAENAKRSRNCAVSNAKSTFPNAKSTFQNAKLNQRSRTLNQCSRERKINAPRRKIIAPECKINAPERKIIVLKRVTKSTFPNVKSMFPNAKSTL